MQATVSFVKMNDVGSRPVGYRAEWGAFNFTTAEEFAELRKRLIGTALKTHCRLPAETYNLYRGPDGDLWLAEVTIGEEGAN